MSLREDVVHALSRLRRSPGYAVLVIVVLALGIGATTAVFSVVDGVLLRDLPYGDPGRLVMLLKKTPRGEFSAFAPAELADFSTRLESFAAVAGAGSQRMQLEPDGGDPVQVLGASVSGAFFSVMGVAPARGRVFVPAEDPAAEAGFAVVSHAFWQGRMGADPEAVGASLRLDGAQYRVIGVMPAGFTFPQQTEVWLRGPYDVPQPPQPLPGDLREMRAMSYFPVLGRLAEGREAADAKADLERLHAALAEDFPREYAERSFGLVSLREQLVGDVEGDLLLLLGAVALVLVLACSNAANLKLARAAAAERETALRGALGAGRWQLVRQRLVESLVLALAGGALGAALASWGVGSLLALAPEDLPRLDEVAVDGRVLAAALGLSLLAGLGAGLLPALQGSRVDLSRVLNEAGGRSSGSLARRRLRALLVAFEVAIALVLLTGAGLMMRSLYNLRAEDPGFEPEGVLTLQSRLPGARYGSPEQRQAFYGQLLSELRTVPGVAAAAVGVGMPFDGVAISMTFGIEGRPEDPGAGEKLANVVAASPDYFRTLEIPLQEGRAFTPADDHGAPVVVVSRSLADLYWPEGDALGRRLSLDPGDEAAWATVVGIAGDVRQNGLDREPPPILYQPVASAPFPFMSLAVRAEGEPLALAPRVREVLQRLDPQLPADDFSTLSRRVARTLAERQFLFLLLASFAGVALVLASVGLYGLLAYSVSQRGREIGIRMALGARRAAVVRMVVGQGLVLAASGLAAGLAAAFAATRLLAARLYGIEPADPATFAAICLLLAATAAAASYLPARRAARVDPNMALRDE